jgi:hypothetical protein
MKFARRHETHFAENFRADNRRFKHRGAGGADLFAGGERGYARAASGMNNRLFESIVVIEAMRQRAVGDHRIGSSHTIRRTDQQACLWPAEFSRHIDGHQAEIHR